MVKKDPSQIHKKAMDYAYDQRIDRTLSFLEMFSDAQKQGFDLYCITMTMDQAEDYISQLKYLIQTMPVKTSYEALKSVRKIFIHNLDRCFENAKEPLKYVIRWLNDEETRLVNILPDPETQRQVFILNNGNAKDLALPLNMLKNCKYIERHTSIKLFRAVFNQGNFNRRINWIGTPGEFKYFIQELITICKSYPNNYIQASLYYFQLRKKSGENIINLNSYRPAKRSKINDVIALLR